ncbi:MAG TPA: cytochrome-c oxidase, cbb3-type subunit III [Burkholderiales bacterium]|jgi:cytochrome c oxidase cbb3-type subunit 3
MTDFWSTWVVVLVVFNLGITVFLFLWGLRVDIPTQPDGTSGHVWAHGVLREGVRRLPAWWIALSASSLVAGLAYLALYPGVGAFAGALGWTSADELARNQGANRRLEAPLLERVRGKSVEAIAADPQALAVGQVLFIENCAACHGRDARGNQALGAPDLTDRDWLFGGEGASILASILEGRQSTMPPFGGTKSDQEIRDLANYVLSLSGRAHDSLRAHFGKPAFSACAACHGADGKGNRTLGAPDLTDGFWLYGGGIEDIVETIRRGRNGVMPAFRGRLGEENASLVAAWVYAKSRPTK